MDREGLIKLLDPFIKDKVPKDWRWDRKLNTLARKIPDNELTETMSALETMIYNPMNPKIRPDQEIPGSHGLYLELILRLPSLESNS